MTTAVVVISHQGAQEMLNRNWPWHVRGGCPIFVVDHADKPPMTLPASFVNGYVVKQMSIGTDPDKMPHRWVWRFMSILGHLLKIEECGHFDDYCLIETDGIFVRPLPEHPGGLVTTLAGHRSPGFHARNYYHTPWWMDRKTIKDFIRYGDRLLECNLDECGFIDRFIGLVDALYDLSVTPALSYSQNSLDRPEFIAQAREAIARGAYYVHGVKTLSQLNAVTEGIE